MNIGLLLFPSWHKTISVVSPTGELLRSTDLKLPEPVMMHDMAITENYSIFLDLPLVFTPQEVIVESLASLLKGPLDCQGKIPICHETKASSIWCSCAPLQYC